MCRGPLMKQIITFTIPLIFAGTLQLFFHLSDLIIVGRFASHKALAAVGATTSLTHLIIGVFLGMSVGTNVLTARYIGAKDRKQTSRTLHTSIAFSLSCGAFAAIIGIFFSKYFLTLMNTPSDILNMATLYMQIYFAGMPLVMLYNFGNGVMRAAGDTKRPFYFLLIGGIINVLLNMFFVIVCKMDVEGVAIATVISQGVSALLILQAMSKMGEGCRFRWKNLRIHWKNLKEIMWIGVPAGFQGSCFSIANIMIQSSLNSFGSDIIAGNTVAAQCETFLFITNASFGQAVISFVGQNLGGKQYKRIRQTIKYCAFASSAVTVGLVLLLYIFRTEALSLFNTNPAVIQGGLIRFSIVLPFLWVASFMEIFISALRGLGYSIAPTVFMILGVCVYRIIWNETIFRMYPEVRVLLASYPISWAIVAVCAGTYCFFVLQKKISKNNVSNTSAVKEK